MALFFYGLGLSILPALGEVYLVTFKSDIKNTHKYNSKVVD